MMKKLGICFILFLLVGLVGCARTSVSDTFRFESRGFDLLIGEERSLKMILASSDADVTIVYEMESLTIDQSEEIILASTILELKGSATTVTANDTTKGKNDVLKVLGLQEGTIRLTAYMKDNPTIVDTITINVKKVPLGGFKLIVSKEKFYIGEVVEATTEMYPSGIDGSVVLKSENEKIAKITTDGKILGVGAGTVTITAQSVYDPTLITKKEIQVQYRQATEVNITETEITILTTTTYQIQATVLPVEANQAVTYEVKAVTPATAVASVNSSGLITAGKDAGTCTITVYDASKGVSVVLTVHVEYATPTDLVVLSEAITVDVGAKKTTTYIVSPNNASKVLVLGYENEADKNIAKIESNGNGTLTITGLAAGIVTLRVATENGLFEAYIEVTVVPAAPQAVIVSAYNKNLIIGETVTLIGSVTPSGALQGLLFSSEDETIATVDQHGVVTAVAAGTTYIAVTDETGTKSIRCEITVVDPA